LKVPEEKIKELVQVAIEQPQSSASGLLESYETKFGESLKVSVQTVRSYLRREHFSKSKGTFEHPNKFKTPEKLSYYRSFLRLQSFTPWDVQWGFCFQDESHIEKNGNQNNQNCVGSLSFCLRFSDQGCVSLWTRNKCTILRKRFKKSDNCEKFTVCGVTMLHQKVPILFKIIPHYSNGPHYDKFMTEQVLPFLIPGNTVFVDNQNYHVKGPHFEHIHQTYKAAGVNYHR
jgi:hypothetical protein